MTDIKKGPTTSNQGQNNSGWVINDSIIDAGSSELAYVFKGHDKTLNKLFLVWLAIIAITFFLLHITVIKGIVAFFIIFVSGIFLVFNRMSADEDKIWKEFYEQFAKLNNLNYQEKGDPKEVLDSTLFNTIFIQKVWHVISGTWNGYPLKFFMYAPYKRKADLKDNTFNDVPPGPYDSSTVVQIEMPSKLSTIQLVVSDKWSEWFGSYGSGSVEVKPEGNFSQTFHLFAKPGHEVDALEIFSPDVMDKMLTNWPEFDIVFNETGMKIFHFRAVGKKAELQKMCDLMVYLNAKIEPVIKRMR